jgi:hypothetical protein
MLVTDTSYSVHLVLQTHLGTENYLTELFLRLRSRCQCFSAGVFSILKPFAILLLDIVPKVWFLERYCSQWNLVGIGMRVTCDSVRSQCER